jgi:beta-1,4-mannosyl-glycoprotein beta-1,4-N-acetylglucosaminyltransferase
MINKIADCITFFDNNFMFKLRYKILEKYVDYFVICESKYDHTGKLKKKNFIWDKSYNKKKIKYFFLKNPFPKKNNRWENQAMQREYLLKCTKFLSPEDYIFFSDPDEIIKPKFLKNFSLKKKYGIFLHDCFNYKFNLYNPHESPWEGTRVAKKKNLKSLDFLRQKILTKNLRYKFYRIDKEKDIQVFKNAGWHFNNIMPVKQISLKLKTFAHSEFSSKNFSSSVVIQQKIKKKIDLFNRGHKYKKIKLDKRFPNFILLNKKKFRKFIL